MAINPALLSLLGQQAIPQLGTPGMTPGFNPNVQEPTEDIVVTAPEKLEYQAPAYRMNDVPTEDVMINQAAPDTSAFPRTVASPQEIARAQTLTGLPEHKGLFGVKGTLRDILGVVGDAFLVNSGRKEIYAPQRQRERLGDAMVGFGQGNPEADNAAIARVMAIDPEAGRALVEQTQQQAVRQQAANQAAQVQAAARFDKARTLASNIMNVVAQRGDAALLPQALAQIEKMTGFRAADLGLDPSMGLDDIKFYASSGVNRQQQENLNTNQNRLQETVRHNKATEQIQRDRPAPAGRNPPQPTAVSLAAPIIQKMQNNPRGYQSLSQPEREVLQAAGMDPTRRGVKKESALDRMRNKGGATAAPSGGYSSPSTQAGAHPGFTVRKVN